jgi:hypothetical protein
LDIFNIQGNGSTVVSAPANGFTAGFAVTVGGQNRYYADQYRGYLAGIHYVDFLGRAGSDSIGFVSGLGASNTLSVRPNFGSISLGSQSSLGDGGNTIYIKTSTLAGKLPPTASIVDGIAFYSNDITAGNAAPHFRTENGSVIKLYQQSAVTSSQGIADALTNLGFLTGSSVITNPSIFPFTGSALITGSLDVTGNTKVTGSINNTLTSTSTLGLRQTTLGSYSLGSQVVGGSYTNLNFSGSIAHTVQSSSAADMRIGVSSGSISIPSFGISFPAEIVGFNIISGSNYSSIFSQRVDTTALGGGPLTQTGMVSVFGGNEQYQILTNSQEKSLRLAKFNTAGKSIKLELNTNSTGFVLDNDLSDTSASLFKILNSTSENIFEVSQDKVTQISGLVTITADNTGIGTITPDGTSILDLTSTTKGFLPPRMREFERDDIVSPAVGLMVYNTDTDEINVYTNNNGWRILAYV